MFLPEIYSSCFSLIWLTASYKNIHLLAANTTFRLYKEFDYKKYGGFGHIDVYIGLIFENMKLERRT